jgi:hypothetical protein
VMAFEAPGSRSTRPNPTSCWQRHAGGRVGGVQLHHLGPAPAARVGHGEGRPCLAAYVDGVALQLQGAVVERCVAEAVAAFRRGDSRSRGGGWRACRPDQLSPRWDRPAASARPRYADMSRSYHQCRDSYPLFTGEGVNQPSGNDRGHRNHRDQESWSRPHHRQRLPLGRRNRLAFAKRFA